MDNNSFNLNVIAKLNKILSKSAINNDLKTLNNTMSVKVLAKLSKTLATRELKKQLRELNELYVNVGTKIDKSTKTQILQNIKYLQQTISDLEIGIKASKINRDIENVRSRVQKKVQSNPISFNLEIKKNKLISDIEYLGNRYSKLFSNVSASNKYENLMNSAYNVSNEQQLTATRVELEAFTSELKANGLAAQSTGDKWEKLINRAKELFSAAAIIRTIFDQARQAVSTAIDLDTVYTDLINVNNQLERGDYAEYLSKCNQKAKELATTQKEFIEGATEFSKSGYNLTISNKLTEVSTILSNVGEMSASDSAKAIISGVQAFDIVNGYTDVVDKAQILVDIYNEVGNTASITTSEIAQGVQSVGSVFSDANTSAQEFISLLAAGNRQFQNADALALGLRTAALRIRGCTSELATMGEETDGVYTSASELADEIRGLTNINGSGGVQILEADGETLRSIYDIFLDISKVYQQMSDTDASALLELIAGKNRASAISAVLNNMSEAQDIYQRSLEAAGSAQEEYNKYLESTEAHIKQFQATLVETYTSFINGDMVSHMADIGSVILDLNNKTGLLQHTLIAIATLKIGEGIATIGGAIAGTVTQMNTLGSAIQQVKNLPLDDVLRRYALGDLGEATKALTEKNLKLLLSQKELGESDRIAILKKQALTEVEAHAKLEKLGLTDATKKNTAANIANAGSANASKGAFTGLATSIKATWAAMSLLEKASIIFAAVSTAWSIYSMIAGNYNQKAEAARQKAKEAADEANTLSSEISELTHKYLSLSEAVKAGVSTKEDLISTQKELLKKLGLEGEGIDDLIAKYGSLSDAIRQVSIDSLKNAQIDLIAGVGAAREELLEAGKDGFWGKKSIVAMGEDAGKAWQALEDAGIVSSGVHTDKGGEWFLPGDDSVEGILSNYKILEEALSALRDSSAFTAEELPNNPLYETIYERYSELKDAVNSYNSAIDNLNENLSQQIMLTALQGSEIPKTEEDFATFRQELIDTAVESKQFIGSEQEITDAINNYLATVPEFTGFYNDPLEKQLEKESERGKDIITTLSTQLNNSQDSLDKFQSSVKSASDAFSTLLSGNYSSSELLDSIQTINQAVTDMGQKIDWEEIGSLDELGDKLEEVSRAYAESILSGTGIKADSDFGQMLTDIIQQMYEVETKFTGMNAQLDRLQSSYQTLIDVIENFNETGLITLDNLQSLLTADENLIAMLEVENGQLVINQEAYENLVAVQLLEFKEKLDNAAAAEIEALALNKAEEATENNAQASENAVAKLDAETEALKRNTEAASENAITKAIANAEEAGVTEEEIQNVLDKYENIWNAAVNSYSKDLPTFILGSRSSSGSKSSSSSSESDFEETFDWLETAIDRIERSISNLDSKASSVYRSWSERNSNLKAELADVKKEMDIQASGYNKYMQQAASVGLSEEWASKVRNGQIDSTNITDKALAEQIKQYQDYYEKALKCQDAVEDLRESVSKLYKTAFNNIVSQFDSIVSAIENSKSMLDEQINQAEERGYIANVAYYEALIKVEQKNIEQLTKERTSLQSALADAVNSGAIAEGSQEWADMVKQINDVSLSIEEANTAMLKYGNSIRDIQWQIFDLIQDRISRISSESDFLINLLSNDKQYDDRGQFTDAGMTTVGLHGMNYNVYMAQADKYAQEMLRIDKELAKDPYNQDLAKRRQELLELQQEMIIAAEDEKQAIVDMVEEGINLELDALKELIDTYTEALDAQKDLYDYQKNIAKQTEEIASLQKQLSAYEGDLSEEARAKVQQLKVSLENAQEQLEETEYERYISDQKKLLDDLYLEYETALNQRLDNIDALIADMIASSNANAGMISDVLSSKADSVGYYLSESMEDIWNTNTDSMLDALAMYDSNVVSGFAAVNTSVGEVIRGVTETVSGIGNVNTTITNAINSVTANMQAILDRLSSISTMQSASAASSYYGGSGGTSSSGGSTSGSGSSTGNTGFFIYSKNSYPKDKLNIDTSIIDRLRYFDFDSSFSARQMYYSKMGLPGTYTGTADQNAKMIEWMKLNGYKNGVFDLKKDEWAWTQEDGKPEVILNPDGSIIRPDGSVLTPLRQGDSVLNSDATKNLFNFMNDPQRFIRVQSGNIPIPQNDRQEIISNDIQLSIQLPNVQNYEQFKHALQHDRQFEKVVQAMTTGRAAGGSSLKKYKA